MVSACRSGVWVKTFYSFDIVIHNVWTGIPALLTSLGWSLVLKAGVALVFPEIALRGMARVTPGHSGLLWLPGSIMLAIGLLLAWSLYTRETSPLP